MKEIYLAGGCFWGTEHFLQLVRGVEDTETGYANGNIVNPTYKQVCTDKTGFAETVRVSYDPHVLPLRLLLELYFKIIDPTSLNKQGNDHGTQYRTGIYYTKPEDRVVIDSVMEEVQKKYTKPLAVEVEHIINFFPAEEYHQDYLDKNPTGYCHIRPELFRLAMEANPDPKPFVRPDSATLRTKLTAEQYAVTQEAATERPFTNPYNKEHRDGIYVDITTGEPLFSSRDKFDSPCGWPAFSKPINRYRVKENLDTSHGMVRKEVRSKSGNAHLGHVFNDGPRDKGGMRYCINSASLRFIPKEDMEKEGYGDWMYIFGTTGN